MVNKGSFFQRLKGRWGSASGVRFEEAAASSNGSRPIPSAKAQKGAQPAGPGAQPAGPGAQPAEPEVVRPMGSELGRDYTNEGRAGPIANLAPNCISEMYQLKTCFDNSRK